jgi:malate synthase
LRSNLRVGVRYLEAWLRGVGCVPLDHLMEDAATAEIARAQVWQWRRHGASLADGRAITGDLVRELLASETAAFEGGKYREALALFESLVFSDDFVDFLTLPAYGQLEPAAVRQS